MEKTTGKTVVVFLVYKNFITKITRWKIYEFPICEVKGISQNISCSILKTEFPKSGTGESAEKILAVSKTKKTLTQ